jgi:hypothetical protein
MSSARLRESRERGLHCGAIILQRSSLEGECDGTPSLL